MDEVIQLRREIHRHAELPFLEVHAAAVVLRDLSDLPLTLRMGGAAMRTDNVVDYPSTEERRAAGERAVAAGMDAAVVDRLVEEGTAVVADLEGNRPGPTWALRFDTDGLPIVEATDADHLPAAEGFASVTDAMHACGHDGHTAIGVVLAKRLADRDFPGRVRFLFQPAEEGARGAAAMIGAGVLDGVDRFVALHLGHALPAGTAVGTGVGIQATAKFRIRFAGVAAHAAGSPQDGRNALAACASAALHLLALPRSSRGTTNVNVGTIHGGDATNIIPPSAVLTGEVRSDCAEVCEDLLARARAVVDGAASMWGVQAVFEVTADSTTLEPDDVLVDEVVQVAERLLGPGQVRRTALMAASDDATVFARAVQSAGGLATYVMVGGANAYPHHSSRFDIDEASLPVSVAWLEEIIRSHRSEDVV